MKLPTALAPLRDSDFRIYWAGQAVSLTGTWMQAMAQSYVLAKMAGSATAYGLSALVGALPILLLSGRGGEMADRLDKRRILIVTQLCMMVLALVFAWLIHTGLLSVGIIYVMAALLGVVTAFDLPASQALPPELVEPEQIGTAVALMQQIFHGARLVGPSVAGLLMARFGDPAAFVANGLSFVAVVGSLLAISPREKRRGAARKRAQGGFKEGLAYVRKDPILGPLMVLAALTTGSVFPFVTVLMAYYVRRVVGTEDASIIGAVMSASGLGSLLGATVILWGSPSSRRYWLVAGILGASAAALALAFYPVARLVIPVTGVAAFSVSSVNGRVSQTVQERSPPELRGRVMGIYSMAFNGVMPFAALSITVLADRITYPRAMEIFAVAYAVLGLLLVAAAWRALSMLRSVCPESRGRAARRDEAPGPDEAPDAARASQRPG
jgi:MFS family permease